MAEDNCFICKEALNKYERITAKKKAIESFISASIKRQDKKYIKYKLRKKKSITVHDKCRKFYTHPRHIKAYKNTEKLSVSTGSTRSTGLNFDFEINCLYCGNDAGKIFLSNQAKKKNKSKRQIVSTVSSKNFRKNVVDKSIDRSDKWGNEVLDRIASTSDLISVRARYHGFCHLSFFSDSNPADKTVSSTSQIIEVIEKFIADNPHEHQFSFKAIVESYEGEAANNQWIKNKLYEKLGDEIIITSTPGVEPVIYLRDACHKILLRNFQDCNNEEPDRMKIVTAAAKIVTEDIRNAEYDVDNYPSPNSFLENVEEVIPKSLRVLLNKIVLSDKRGKEDGKFISKIVAIAHTIISSVRPRGFISCLKIGLGAVLNKKFGSKSLLNILSALGFSCSYDEALLFEASVLSAPNNVTIDPESFTQFVFDNADHNVNTIDGLNTFHAMGGIECVSPKSAVSCYSRIPKLKAIPSRDTIGSFGTFPLKVFHGHKKAGLKNVPVENLDVKNPTITYEFDISATDFLWSYNQKTCCSDLQGWNGFMEDLTKDKAYQTSRIVCLPFLNYPPSNYDTIYTVLSFAAERMTDKIQKTAFVTFDQPLYWKAKEILASAEDALKNVVVRLGGFHLIMSFLGSIGQIMDGSGLKELFSEFYAPASVDKMLAGHAYSRAVRAHILVHCALVQIIICTTNFTEDESSKLKLILEKPEDIFENIDKDVQFKIIKSKFIENVKRLAGNSDTAKLWIQYLHMVSLLKMFIEAEKSGNWDLHLSTVHRMLPFFHSSGHFLYAKSAHLYLQDMYNLKDRMDTAEYTEFVNGKFTVRRTDKFWSGIWSDMTIEQALMRAIKDVGGLTRGRGLTDSILSKWVLTTPALVDLIEALTDFCKVFLATTEQHVDSRATRIARDIADILKILSWFQSHDPFPETEGLVSLSSGLKGGPNDNINCHQALQIGLKCLTNMWQISDSGSPNSFGDVKYRRKNKITPLKALVSSIKVSDRSVTIDPSLLFQRICVIKKSDEELRTYFGYELAPVPMSMFDDTGMRKSPKAKLFEFFNSIDSPSRGNDVYVIDGGFFVHKVVWQQKEIFNQILTRYVNYLKNNYSNNCVVVFDGYPDKGEEKYTKSSERLRRARINSAPEIVCDANMPSTLSQDKFLSNDKNKDHLIDILSHRLRTEGFVVKQAAEDADCLIIETAISLSERYDSVYVVGEDVDLLVILTQMAQYQQNVYMLKPSRGSVEQKLFSSNSFKYPEIRHLLSFAHAFTGCDTTSALYKQGKAKLIKLLQNDTNGIRKEAEIFNSSNALKSSIYVAGQTVLMTLYGAKDTSNCVLDDFRFTCFMRSTLKNTFNLSCLPPTAEAINEHLLRTFLQVCEWRGDHSKDPMQWGWKSINDMLVPIMCRKDPIPPNLLNIISCGCDKSNCISNCTCRKVGLKCTVLCKKCCGQTCSNICEPEIILTDDEVDDDLLLKLTNEDADWTAVDSTDMRKKPLEERADLRVVKKPKLV